MALFLPLAESHGNQAATGNRKSGKMARILSGVLVAGTVTIADPLVKATDLIMATHSTLGTVTAAKILTVTRSAGTSITVTSTDNTDTSTVAVLVIPTV